MEVWKKNETHHEFAASGRTKKNATGNRERVSPSARPPVAPVQNASASRADRRVNDILRAPPSSPFPWRGTGPQVRTDDVTRKRSYTAGAGTEWLRAHSGDRTVGKPVRDTAERYTWTTRAYIVIVLCFSFTRFEGVSQLPPGLLRLPSLLIRRPSSNRLRTVRPPLTLLRGLSPAGQSVETPLG